MENNEPKWKTLQDIIDHWSKEDVAMELLKEHGFEKGVIINDIEHYENESCRKGLIYHIQDMYSAMHHKILIDIKIGQPSTDQVYDAIYGVGKECNRRIIIFTEDLNKDDRNNPAADMHVVDGLLAVMNEYPLNLELYYFHEDTFHLIIYNTCWWDKPYPKYPITNLPTKEQFRFEEFWSIYVDSLAEGSYDPWEAFSETFRNTSDYGYQLFVDPIADMPAYWNESGIRFLVRQTDDSHSHLKTLWDAKKDEIKGKYEAWNVYFEYVIGKVPIITIRYSDKPIEWLMTSTSKEKMELAKELYDAMWALRRFLENACKECGVPVNY